MLKQVLFIEKNNNRNDRKKMTYRLLITLNAHIAAANGLRVEIT